MSYNAKMLLHYLSLLPVIEADPPSHSLTSPSTSACGGGPDHSPATDDSVFSEGDDTQSLVDTLDPHPTSSLNASCPSDPTDVSYGIDVWNCFACLPAEPTPDDHVDSITVRKF